MTDFEKTVHPNIIRAQKSGRYYLRIKRSPRPELFVSLKTVRMNEAREKADRIIEQYLGKKISGRPLVKDIWNDLIVLHENKAKKTYQSFEMHWRVHLLPFFGHMLIEDVNEKTWEQYIAYTTRRTPGRKLFNDRKHLIKALVYAVTQGLISRKPSLRNPDGKSEAGKVYTDDEIKRLLIHADDDLGLKILMAFTMGMRKSEIMKLSWDRVDLKSNIIKLRAIDTKTRRARSFGISPVVKSLLASRNETSGSAWVFPRHDDKKYPQTEFRKTWVTCKRSAKVVGRFHDLRHTFLTKAFKKNINPALICHYAGLSLEEAQRTYLHFTVEDTRVVSEVIKQ